MSTISPETALVYVMVVVSASDERMTDSEITRMTGLIGYLPAFQHYNTARLSDDTAACIELLQSEEGLDAVLGLVDEAIPDTHIDLIYAVACDVAASDGMLTQEELRLLEIIRHYFDIDRLLAAAIEKGVAARQRSLPQS